MVDSVLDVGPARAGEKYETIHGERFELRGVGTLEELLAQK